jgi:hypothetical protein
MTATLSTGALHRRSSAAAIAAPFVAPYVHEVIDEARNAKDDEPHVIIPPGTSHPEK